LFFLLPLLLSWWWCLLFVLAETKISPKIYTPRVLPTIRDCLEGLALMIWTSRMVLAAPCPLLTPPPSSSPPKTPHWSYSAQTRSQNEKKNPPPQTVPAPTDTISLSPASTSVWWVD
jgi:hypothetical protein